MAVETCLFMMGGVLGRMLGPIAQNWYEHNTAHGRQMVKDAENKKRRDYEIEREHKAIVREEEYQMFLREQAVKFKEKIRMAEEDLLISQQKWNQKEFFDKCFPLRNPYDMPLGVVLKEAENSTYTLKTTKAANNKEVVPLRVISALTTSSETVAKNTVNTINSRLSSFLINNYPVNGLNCVFSDIGSWKEQIPVNDASMNYLFDGLKGQPVLVLAPIFEDGGDKLSLKAWMWGPGEDVQYPTGIDCGWIDIDLIAKQIALKHVKLYVERNNKVGQTIESELMHMMYDLALTIDDNKGIISDKEIESLIRQAKTPNDISNSVLAELNETMSQYLSCFSGMYTDAYHLTGYGTLPKLPSILSHFDKIEMLMPTVAVFYQSLIRSGLSKNMLTTHSACLLEYQLANAMHVDSQTKRLLISDANALYTQLISDNLLTDDERNYFKEIRKASCQSPRIFSINRI